MKHSSFIAKVFITISCLLLMLPLVFVNFEKDKISKNENRKLAQFVPPFEGGQINRSFTSGFTAWIRDNIGFREEAIMVDTFVKYNLFKKISRNDYIEGQDKWLFYVNDNVIKDYQNKTDYSDEEILEFSNQFSRLDDYLKSKGIPFLMTIIPDKKSVYPEYYDSNILKTENEPLFDKVKKSLSENTDIDFIFMKDYLDDYKKNGYKVYFSNYDHSHWNDRGAFIGYRVIMGELARHLTELKVLDESDYEIETKQLTKKLNDVIPFNETSEVFSLKDSGNVSNTTDTIQELNLALKENCIRYTNSNESLPKILIFGDSYIRSFILEDIAESFSDTVCIIHNNLDRIPYLVDIFDPDIVLYEGVERMIAIDTYNHLLSKNIYQNEIKEVIEQMPIKEEDTIFALDYFNGKNYDDEIYVGEGETSVEFKGWAVDKLQQSSAFNVYIKIGDEYYSGVYGSGRPDVAKWLDNENYNKIGFNIIVPAECLKDTEYVEFIIVSNDSTYKYSPIRVKVRNKS